MIFATILAVTTFAHTGDYVLDTAESYSDCMAKTATHSASLTDNLSLDQWLAQFNIELNPLHVESLSVECVAVEDEQIP